MAMRQGLGGARGIEDGRPQWVDVDALELQPDDPDWPAYLDPSKRRVWQHPITGQMWSWKRQERYLYERMDWRRRVSPDDVQHEERLRFRRVAKDAGESPEYYSAPPARTVAYQRAGWAPKNAKKTAPPPGVPVGRSSRS